jgi:hypothetical protein
MKSTSPPLVGLELKFTLPPGTYATMMLREITKQGTDTDFQAQLTAATAGPPPARGTVAPAAVALPETVPVSVDDVPVAMETTDVAEETMELKQGQVVVDVEVDFVDGDSAAPLKRRKI